MNILQKYFKVDNKVYVSMDWWSYNETGYENGCYYFKSGIIICYKNGKPYWENDLTYTKMMNNILLFKKYNSEKL